MYKAIFDYEGNTNEATGETIEQAVRNLQQKLAANDPDYDPAVGYPEDLEYQEWTTIWTQVDPQTEEEIEEKTVNSSGILWYGELVGRIEVV